MITRHDLVVPRYWTRLIWPGGVLRPATRITLDLDDTTGTATVAACHPSLTGEWIPEELADLACDAGLHDALGCAGRCGFLAS